MKAASAGFIAHIEREATALKTIWRVTRRDGTKFHLTDNDEDLVLDPEGGGSPVTFAAAGGYTRSNIISTAGLSVDNLDISSHLDPDFTSITERDIRAGLFDYAEVEMWLVVFQDTTLGTAPLRRGYLGEVSLEDDTYLAEFRGLVQLLTQSMVEVYSAQCRADLGDVRCKVAISPPVLARGATLSVSFEVGDRFVVETLGRVRVPLTNAGFDDGDLTGWTTDSGSPSVVTSQAGLSPQAGTHFLTGLAASSAAFAVSQVVDMTSLLVLATVDAGGYVFDYESYRANADVDDTGRVLVEFLNAADGVIGTAFDSTTEEITPVDTWGGKTATAVAVPALTRKIKVTLNGVLVTGTTCDAAHDSAAAQFRLVSEVSGSWENTEDTVYRATTAGTTDPQFQPDYDTTPGNTTADGDAVLTAEEAFKRFAVVATVIDNRDFTVTVDESRASADDWFNHGAVEWETGNNSDVTPMEVKDWLASVTTGATTLDVDDTNTFSRPAGSFVDDGFVAGMKIVTANFTDGANNGTFTVAAVNPTTLDVMEATLVAESGTADETMISIGAVTLFLGMPFEIEVGDRVTIYRGCRKGVTDCKIFANINNYRGEPYIPGTDHLIRSPDAPQG